MHIHVQSNPVNHRRGIARLTNLPVLDHTPFEALHIYAQGRQCGKEDDSLDADLFAFHAQAQLPNSGK